MQHVVDDHEERQVKARKTIMSVFGGLVKKQAMPKFAIYSRLDKNLLKLMLIRATTYDDEEIEGFRQKYFHPE